MPRGLPEMIEIPLGTLLSLGWLPWVGRGSAPPVTQVTIKPTLRHCQPLSGPAGLGAQKTAGRPPLRSGKGRQVRFRCTGSCGTVGIASPLTPRWKTSSAPGFPPSWVSPQTVEGGPSCGVRGHFHQRGLLSTNCGPGVNSHKTAAHRAAGWELLI